MAAITDIASTTPTTVPHSYAAHCSLPRSAGLGVYLSRADVGTSLNPFRCDFERVLSHVCRQVHPEMQVLSIHPRNYSYVMLAVYRLLRHLIPPVDTAAAATKSSSSDAPPSSAAASINVALAAVTSRITEVYPSELRKHAIIACREASRDEKTAHEAVFTAERFVQPLLTIDAALDERELSAWQRWLISSPTWQKLAGCAVEYIAAEWMELLGDFLRHNSWLRSPIACLHEQVLADDDELLQLWLTIGMPADYPAELDSDMQSAYKQQFEQQMRAAVAQSAPWMFDAQQVQQRVADWLHGRLPSGDAVFFRRYHIRPLWHSGVDVSDVESTLSDAQHHFTTHDFGDAEPDDIWVERDSDMTMECGIDIVDAANISRRLIINCRISIESCNSKQRRLYVTVKGGGEWTDNVIGSIVLKEDGTSIKPYQSYSLIELIFHNSTLQPQAQPNSPHPLCDYVCHGHLHGLSEQQWEEAMGGRLRIGYRSSADPLESKDEQADDEQAATSNDGMFPARLADVLDREQYRRLQRTEIRRMVAIATRLCLLDEGVDVAVFPCWQPAEMRRQFEAAAQTRLETGVAELQVSLPRELQAIVVAYNPLLVDVPA